MKVKIWLASILAFAVTFPAWGQQSAPASTASPKPAPPKSSSSLQSLPAAMQKIQKELNKVGKLSFVVDFSFADEKGASKVMEEDSKVVADPAGCILRYHWWRSMHGEVVNDEDVSLSLRDVKGVWTMSSDEAMQKVAEKEGTQDEEPKQGYYERFAPPLYLVAIRMANDDENALPFTDRKQAQRVGRAMARAVKLCGGKTEPY